MEAFDDEHAHLGVAQLRAELQACDDDYVLLPPLPGKQAHVRFLGRFEQREVAWDMQLYTLEHHQQLRGPVPTEGLTLRGLMIIERVSADACRLEVALNVPSIDEPTIRKTIVMIRNYRKLRPGLRIWGDEAT